MKKESMEPLRESKGFTLIELIVAIMILVVLTGLLAPNLLVQVERAREAVDVNYIDNARTQIMLMAMDDSNFRELKDPTGTVSYDTDGWYAYNFKTNTLARYTSSLGDGYKGLMGTATKGKTDFKDLGVNIIGDLDNGSASSSYMLVGYKDGEVYIRLDSQTAEGPANTGTGQAAVGRVTRPTTPGSAGPSPKPGAPTTAPPPKRP